MKWLLSLGSIRSTFVFILFQASILQLAPLANAHNQRYSPLSQILHFEGTLFISNGMNDLFAMDVETGEMQCQHLLLCRGRNYWM